MNGKQEGDRNGNTIFVLLDDPDDVAAFAGPKEIDVDKLGDQLKRFTEAISKALERCRSVGGQYDLAEIVLEAKLTAEVGFALVSKAGVEGTVSLKFARRG